MLRYWIGSNDKGTDIIVEDGFNWDKLGRVV